MIQPLDGLLKLTDATSKIAILPIVIVAAIVVLLGGAFVVAAWRRYFRRLFEARFRKQEDGTYLAHWPPHQGQPIEVYRIGAVTKERVLACLVGASVLSTSLFVATLIAAAAVNVLWPTSLMVPGALLLSAVAFAPQLFASRRARSLVVTGTRVVDSVENIRPALPPPEISTKSLRLIVGVSCIIAITGLAVCVIFLLDPDSSAIIWTDVVELMLLLVVMPLSVAFVGWWALPRVRL